MLAGGEKRKIGCGDWSTASPPATIVLYLDLFCFAVCPSVNADDGYALSSRSVAASVWCHPVCRTVLLIEPFRVLIRRFSVAMVAGYGW
ncbi:hypothetical protein HanRHA438_Chr16g0777811 [Helianthus annuus]|nr:hypothetical protein HanRHA438_Chr16g0777811 [Helianthus annuus]